MTRPDSRISMASLIVGVVGIIVWSPDIWADELEDAGLIVTVEPQLIAPGTRPAWAEEAGYALHVEVPGASAGHAVRLEVWSHGDWVAQDQGATDDRGRVQLQTTDGSFGRIVTDVDGVQVKTDVPMNTGPVLYWTEQFNDDSLDDQWLVVDQPDDDSCTTSDASATDVSDGLLALSVEDDADGLCTRPGQVAQVNGHIILRGAVGYGTTAARIKFPLSREVIGQFWLQPGDPGLPWVMDEGHEGVVIGSMAGTDRDPRFDTAVHRIVNGTIKTSRRIISKEDAPNDGLFHVYSVDWRPDGYTFKIDGQTIRTVHAEGPLPPMTIGLAMLAPKMHLPSDPEQRTMYVDWLRVWG